MHDISLAGGFSDQEWWRFCMFHARSVAHRENRTLSIESKVKTRGLQERRQECWRFVRVDCVDEMPSPLVDNNESILCLRYARRHHVRSGTEEIETRVECLVESLDQESVKKQLTSIVPFVEFYMPLPSLLL
jgi:hypothetical protein